MNNNPQSVQSAIAALKQCHTDCHQALHHLEHDGSVTQVKQLVARLIAKAANALTVL